MSSTSDRPDDEALDQQQITADLFRVLRGQDNLAFANSRADVELYAARLRDMCEAAGLPMSSSRTTEAFPRSFGKKSKPR